MVNRNQDIMVKAAEGSLKVKALSDQMWKMATMGLKEIGITVTPR